VQVQRLIWLGTRTPAFRATRDFFDRALGLPVGVERPHFVRFDLPDGGSVEVFDAEQDPCTHFSTGPVLGFEVSDFDAARNQLVAAGYPLTGPVGGTPGEYRWQHFRGPDGLVLEIVDYPDRPAPRAPSGPLEVQKLAWMGISTPDLPHLARFYKRTLGLAVQEDGNDLIECRLPDGSSVEAFRRGSPMDHAHFRTGPVPGLGVTDVQRAARVLQDHGVTILQFRYLSEGGWAHFRAPDGYVYELKQVPRAP
jgi:predicted enzyme related to lactoylglutathione lyase